MSSTGEDFYVLGLKDDLWYARSVESGSRIAVGHSPHDIVRQCEERGFKMHSVTEDAINELYRYLSVVVPVVDYLKAEFPDHIHAPDDDRGPLGFVDMGRR